jgi:hypothetical protein
MRERARAALALDTERVGGPLGFRPTGATGPEDVDNASRDEPWETEEDWRDGPGAELLYFYNERKFHDRKGFFCDLAGSPACLALGHTEPPNDAPWGDEDDDPNAEDHIHGWDGDIICQATSYGAACSQCEGECDLNTVEPLPAAEFWRRVSFGYSDRRIP